MQVRDLYEFGPYRLDASARVLLRGGAVVPLTPKALEILAVLVKNRGELVSKEELMKAVWPDTFVEEGSLTQNISILRKVLGPDAEGRPYIETMAKRGYRFVAQARVVELGLAGWALGPPWRFPIGRALVPGPRHLLAWGQVMADQQAAQERELMRRWVETWRRAGPELDEIRRREIEATDPREAIRQLFGSATALQDLPPRTTSGLVEQQAWFAKLRR